MEEEHNYRKAFDWLVAQGVLQDLPDGLSLVDIYHDDWCGVNQGKLCNCRPDIKFKGKLLRYPARILGSTYAPNA